MLPIIHIIHPNGTNRPFGLCGPKPRKKLWQMAHDAHSLDSTRKPGCKTKGKNQGIASGFSKSHKTSENGPRCLQQNSDIFLQN